MLKKKKKIIRKTKMQMNIKFSESRELTIRDNYPDYMAKTVKTNKADNNNHSMV